MVVYKNKGTKLERYIRIIQAKAKKYASKLAKFDKIRAQIISKYQ